MPRTVKISIGVVALLAGAVGAYGYLRREEPEKVTVVKLTRRPIEDAVTATGAVAAVRTVLVTVEPGSRIASTHFEEGNHVQRGQLLAKIDDSELVAQLSQNQANLALAETNLAGAEVNLQRLRRLYEKGFAARQEVESTERQVDTHRAQISQFKAAIALLDVKRAHTSVPSPISGIVTRKLVEAGSIVAAAGGPGGAQPPAVAELTELDSTEFRADVDQADIAKVRVGQPATVQVDALPQRTFPATAHEIAVVSTPDAASRVRYAVKLTVGEANARLKVGMTGSAKFVVARKGGAWTLPLSVILQQGDDEYVFVVEDRRAVRKKIKTGLQSEDLVEVVSGLNPEDLVVNEGRAKLKDGRRVELADAKR
ncbi:MAG: efflux RND transporter periplasmic adaptor subunit [Candidatus Rokubacteria bacterium]|nr:efflux RND transporter periplasmic adaptor subunit [Candidatus Rokubacteria bacterium]